MGGMSIGEKRRFDQGMVRKKELVSYAAGARF
jgi:hypothetical protein